MEKKEHIKTDKGYLLPVVIKYRKLSTAVTCEFCRQEGIYICGECVDEKGYILCPLCHSRVFRCFDEIKEIHSMGDSQCQNNEEKKS